LVHENQEFFHGKGLKTKFTGTMGDETEKGSDNSRVSALKGFTFSDQQSEKTGDPSKEDENLLNS